MFNGVDSSKCREIVFSILICFLLDDSGATIFTQMQNAYFLDDNSLRFSSYLLPDDNTILTSGNENGSAQNSPVYDEQSIDSVFYGLPATTSEVVVNGQENRVLQIVAQPKTFYRGRYGSETGGKNQPYRLIQIEDGSNEYTYPTVKVLTFLLKIIHASNVILFFPVDPILVSIRSTFVYSSNISHCYCKWKTLPLYSSLSN
jgi:hypothetical protein